MVGVSSSLLISKAAGMLSDLVVRKGGGGLLLARSFDMRPFFPDMLSDLVVRKGGGGVAVCATI
jgi:hypothetical protein